MNKRSAVIIAGALVLIGAIAWTLGARKQSASDAESAASAEQAGDVAPAPRTSKMTTQRAPVQRSRTLCTAAEGAGTGVARPLKAECSEGGRLSATNLAMSRHRAALRRTGFVSADVSSNQLKKQICN